jgi:DNA repair protein RAD5
MVFNEGQETLGEQVLRERKSSLLKLFDAVGLKPRAGADSSKHQDKSDKGLHEEAVKEMTKANKLRAPVKTEIVGDGEEVEVEEGVDLSENELDMIYKKCVLTIF